MENKTALGLDENIAAMLCYLFGPFSGIFFLIIERDNKFVRFHALQSTLWFTMLLIVWGIIGVVINVLGWFPLVGSPLSSLVGTLRWLSVGLIYIGSKIVLMVKSFGGATCKVPVIGDVVYTQVNK